MSAIESLLGPGPTPPSGQLPLNPRTLLLEGDVLVHMQEDEAREEVTIYSVPGRLEGASWLEEHGKPWSHAVRLAGDDRAISILNVDPETRAVFLSDVWPRAALDAATFFENLSGHVRRHRLWREALQANELD